MKILITGASSGLGAEFARQYASLDNELVLLARREQNLLALQNELQKSCKNVEIVPVDVTDFPTLQAKIKKIQNIDMVILNAGISLGHKGDIPSIAQFQNLFDVNVLSAHAILEILLPQFRDKRSGTIVFISSLASLFSMPTSKVYSASKRAVNAYAEGVRYKYKPYGVKVITLLPGFIKSEMTDKNEFTMPFILQTQEGVKRMKQAIEKGKEFYAFPFRFYLIIRFVNLLPSLLREKIVHYRK